MRDKHGHKPPAAEDSHAPGQIDREINVRSIVAFLVIVMVATAVSAGLMWFLFKGLLATEVARDPQPLAIVERTAPPPPPAPRLQVDGATDLKTMRAEESAVLEGYGWTDRAAGRVRIPVARALDLVAERGLPPVPPPPPAEARP